MVDCGLRIAESEVRDLKSKVGGLCGSTLPEGEGKKATEVCGSPSQPLSAVRASPRLSAPV